VRTAVLKTEITKYFDSVKNGTYDFKQANYRRESNEFFKETRYLFLITAITSRVVNKIIM